MLSPKRQQVTKLKAAGAQVVVSFSIPAKLRIKAFDEFGRMIPAALQQYSGAH